MNSLGVYAQNTNDRAKAYYLEAFKNYQNKNFSKSLERLAATEEILNGTNAKILSLKVKNYVAQKNYKKAAMYFELFSNNNSKADENLKNDVLSYLVEIEDGMDLLKKNEERKRQAEIKKIAAKKLNTIKAMEKERLAVIERLKESQKEKEIKIKRMLYFANYLVAFPRAGTLIPFLDVKTNKVGYINGQGEFVIKPTYLDGKNFSEGLAVVKSKNEGGYFPLNYTFIDMQGNEVFNYYFSRAENFYNGVAPVCLDVGKPGSRNLKCGLINRKGEKIMKFKYYQIGPFSEGLASICFGKCGFVNVEGELVIPIKHYSPSPFKNGKSKTSVFKKGKIVYIYIDKDGKRIDN
tara:strand:- start:284335 stop:285384 length:1050 start_codon:yes stop_codon:yes gene_type:complete